MHLNVPYGDFAKCAKRSRGRKKKNNWPLRILEIAKTIFFEFSMHLVDTFVAKLQSDKGSQSYCIYVQKHFLSSCQYTYSVAMVVVKSQK